MKKVSPPPGQSRPPVSAKDYRDPRDRSIIVKLPEPEYRAAKNMAKACRVPVPTLIRGLILRTAERNKLSSEDDEEDTGCR